MNVGLLFAGGVALSLLLGYSAPSNPLAADGDASPLDTQESMPSPSSSGLSVVSPLPAGQTEGVAPASKSAPPSPEEVVERMAKSFASTPVLHVRMHNRHRGVEYQGRGWLKLGKARGEVRKEGKLIFATFTDRRRVQEYVPRFKFPNRTEAERVLVEYDKGPNDGGWFRLVDFEFACGPGSCASDAYLADRRPNLPEVFLGNMQGSKMTETEWNGQPCYWYHLESVIGDDKITWDLYVDKVTCKPLRQKALIVSGDKVKKDEVFDYTFEHLANDEGIQWELDPARLKD